MSIRKYILVVIYFVDQQCYRLREICRTKSSQVVLPFWLWGFAVQYIYIYGRHVVTAIVDSVDHADAPLQKSTHTNSKRCREMSAVIQSISQHCMTYLVGRELMGIFLYTNSKPEYFVLPPSFLNVIASQPLSICRFFDISYHAICNGLTSSLVDKHLEYCIHSLSVSVIVLSTFNSIYIAVDFVNREMVGGIDLSKRKPTRLGRTPARSYVNKLSFVTLGACSLIGFAWQ